MAQILISKLTVEDINSALLRLKRTIDNNEAAFDTKVNSAVSNLNIKNTYQALQKYDDSALKKSINDVSDLIKDLNSSLTKNINQTNTNTENINQLRTILANIDVSYDIETNTLYFTDSTGEEHDYELKDTTYSFAWDESTRTFTVTDDLTSDSQSFTFSDTKYTLSYSNGVLTFTPSSGIATNIDLKDTFYTESEIKALVLDLIPNTASSSNQLADKNWVNSSIETATATFRGTFTNINDLYAASGDNNDYAFLKTLDTQSGLYTYDRYKWTPNANPHWQYEYTINTSGFTSDQLAALNSGITCTLVSKITDVYNCKITLCQNGTCVGSFTLNQNSDSSFNLDGGSISACAKTDNVWRSLLATDCATTGSIDSACFSTNIKANSSTGLIQSKNTSNWSCTYSSNASCVGCYILLAQLNGSAYTGNHDNTIGGIVYRNAAGSDVPYRFVILVRGRCTTVNNTYFITDRCTSLFYATYQVGTNGSYTLRLYTKVTTNWTRYNTRIDYLTNGDVSERVSNWTCITFPNTYFSALPSTETQITRSNFYTKCDVGLDNVDNTADVDKSVKNATCFNGCTYAQACTDIRNGLLSDISLNVYCDSTCKCTINNNGSLCLGTLAFDSTDLSDMATKTWVGNQNYCTHDCLVKYGSVTGSADRKLLMAASDGVNGSICQVYFSGGVPLTYNACTGILNIGSDSLTGYLKSFGEVNAKWYCTTCCQVSFSFPAQSTTYILLGLLTASQAQNENQLGFYVCGSNIVNPGVLKILETNAPVFNQNNIELKLANYCNTSYGITGVGFAKNGTAWNCSTCIILKVCNPGSAACSWGVGIYRNQIKNWTTCITCLGSTAPTFDKLIDIPTDCRTFYYNNAVACFSNKIQGPAYDANGCAYITSSAIKDSTITLCLNGASKGTFTLNQAANCTIDFGSFICCAERICRNAVSNNVDRPLALLCSTTSVSDACIFVSNNCQITFNACTGILCSTRFNANGYPLKYKQTLNLSSLCSDCFYPVTFGGATSYEMDIEIQSPSVVAACPYNQNYIHFFIRNNGWSDTPHSLYIQTLRRYDDNENVFGCIGYGSQASTLSVIWLRGGLCYTANANVPMKVNSTNYTNPSSGGSCSIYTVGTSLCGGTNTGVCLFANATSFNHYVQNKSYFCNICADKIQGPAFDANGCAYITAASLPTVNDSTITLCLNGSSKGTFTLNQAANCGIDLGCTICCAIAICRNPISDNVDRPLALLGGTTSIPNACIFVSCSCPLSFNANTGTLVNGDKSSNTNPYLLSKGCCIKLNKGAGQSELLFTVNNNVTDYCSLGMGIGSGCVNRGIYDCCGGTFRWLQYWDANDNEIHNRPTCAPYFRTNCNGYTGFTFKKPDNSGYKVYYLLHDITTWYNGTTSINPKFFVGTITGGRSGGYQNSGITSVDASYAWGRNGAALTCYSDTQHTVYNHNIYSGSLIRPTILKDTVNNKYYSALEMSGSAPYFRFDGFNLGAICGTYVCTTNSSGAMPTGWELLYTGCQKGGRVLTVYCGTTCKCTLYAGDNLCLGTLAFSSATIPTVNNCTITLCLNGASKGTFTLNQTSDKAIDFGSLICCADYVKTTVADDNKDYSLALIGDTTSYQDLRWSCCVKPLVYNPNCGILCSCCIYGGTVLPAFLCYDCATTNACKVCFAMTAGCTYYINVGCIKVSGGQRGTDFTFSSCYYGTTGTITDSFCMHFGSSSSQCARCRNDIRIDASNCSAACGIQGVGFLEQSAWNCWNDIYVRFVPQVSSTYYFSLYRNGINNCFCTKMTCTSTAPSFADYICTKPHGARAFHYMNGDTCLPNLLNFRMPKYSFKCNTSVALTGTTCSKSLLIATADSNPMRRILVSLCSSCAPSYRSNVYIDVMKAGCDDAYSINACYAGVSENIAIPYRISAVQGSIIIDFASCANATLEADLWVSTDLNGESITCAWNGDVTNFAFCDWANCSWSTSITINPKIASSQNIVNALAANIITACCISTTSAKALKKNILPYNESALKVLRDTDIVSFNYKNESDNALPHIGFIADYTCNLLSGKNKDQMRVNDTVGVLIKAVQELDKRTTPWYKKLIIWIKNIGRK